MILLYQLIKTLMTKIIKLIILILMKKVILIPTRINSKRLPAKALMNIENIPMIIYAKRSCLSK